MISSTQDLERDRKSTRLNSSHVRISYAVFCLKKNNRAHGRCPPSVGRALAELLAATQAPSPVRGRRVLLRRLRRTLHPVYRGCFFYEAGGPNRIPPLPPAGALPT